MILFVLLVQNVVPLFVLLLVQNVVLHVMLLLVQNLARRNLISAKKPFEVRQFLFMEFCLGRPWLCWGGGCAVGWGGLVVGVVGVGWGGLGWVGVGWVWVGVGWGGGGRVWTQIVKAKAVGCLDKTSFGKAISLIVLVLLMGGLFI